MHLLLHLPLLLQLLTRIIWLNVENEHFTVEGMRAAAAGGGEVGAGERA